MARNDYVAIDPDRLADELAEVLLATEVTGVALRVALDGPGIARPHPLGDALREPLRARGRDVAHIRAETFWRDASLRFEHGRHDVTAFRDDWLDVAALRREVLGPLGPGGSGGYLPTLRDPTTNRTTREPRRVAAPGSIVIVSGELLLGRDLPFDVAIHLAVGAAARARRTPEEWAWTLPAFEDYNRDVDPLGTADVVVRLDDPRHPAISRLTPRLSGTT
ncbi:MAG TPA: hypothetical protein VGL39_14520 [Jatrophihabitantaceae bacterium]